MSQPQMTEETALQITAEVFAKTQGTLRDHQAMQQALQVLNRCVQVAMATKAEPAPATEGDTE